MVRWDELEGSTSSAMLSAKFDPLDGKRPRDTLLELQASSVSRSALPYVQLKENNDELLVLVDGSG